MYNDTDNKQAPEKPKLAELWQDMPSVLQRMVLIRFATAFVALLAVTLEICVTKDWTYALAYLLAIIAAYCAMDIIWKFGDQRIYVARVIVSKANRPFRWGKQLNVTLRPANIEDVRSEDLQETHQYRLTPNARDAGSITAGTVMDIYFDKNTPDTIIAYTLLGELS